MQALHFHSFSRSLSFITHSAAAAPLEHLLVQLRPPVHKVAAPHLPPPPGWRGLNRAAALAVTGHVSGYWPSRRQAGPATSRADYKPGRLQAGPTRQLQPGTGPFALAPVVSRRRADGGRRRVADKQGGQPAGTRTGHAARRAAHRQAGPYPAGRPMPCWPVPLQGLKGFATVNVRTQEAIEVLSTQVFKGFSGPCLSLGLAGQ